MLNRPPKPFIMPNGPRGVCGVMFSERSTWHHDRVVGYTVVMADSTDNPLRDAQLGAKASLIGYGDTRGSVEIVESFGHYEAEYAAIRKGVGIMHLPQRGLLQLVGGDVKDFLNRMLTQDITALRGGDSVRAFQLNEKGRIIADVIVHHGDVHTWIEADRFDLPALAELYDTSLFGEDLAVVNISDDWTALALHGPQSGDLLRTVVEDDPARMLAMPGTHHVLAAAGEKLTACRRDECGATGVVLWVRQPHAAELYKRLADMAGGLVPDVEADGSGAGAKRAIRGRGIGHLAYNTARIESGTPIYHIDFGPDTLPHEIGTELLDQAVSFTKGCYLGQEIVARMANLGHPKRVLCGLRFDDDRLPVTGAQATEPGDNMAVIGAVTSSTLSPMRGGNAIAFAMLKWGIHQPDTLVKVAAEGELVDSTVQSLRFLA